MKTPPAQHFDMPNPGRNGNVPVSEASLHGLKRRFYLLFLAVLALGTGALWIFLGTSSSSIAMLAFPVVSFTSIAVLLVLWRRPGSVVAIERLVYWLAFPILLGTLYLDLTAAVTSVDRQVALQEFSMWTPVLAVWSFLAFGSRRGVLAMTGFVVATGIIIMFDVLTGPPVAATSGRFLAQLAGSGIFFMVMLFAFAFILERQNEARTIAEAGAEQAVVDPLTGLLNRRGFEARFEQARSFVDKSGASLALYFIDVDDFKQVNDNFGHGGGDAMLRQFAQRLVGAVRDVDLVARVGGDEFVVLAIVSDEANAQLLAEKLVAVYAVPFELAGREVALHTSIGLSVYPKDGELSAVLLSRADTAMYQAKAGGKNGWVAASLGGPTAAVSPPS